MTDHASAQAEDRSHSCAPECAEHPFSSGYDWSGAIRAVTSPGEPEPGAPPGEPTTEYASRLGSGYQLWNTEPYIERVAPLAERIQLARQDGKVYRRRIIVVEDWTEVGAP